MKLSGHELSTDAQGEDVGRLHAELEQLDFVIPQNERNKMLFGDAKVSMQTIAKEVKDL